MAYIETLDIEKFNNWTGNSEYHDVYTVQLGELIDEGLFNWSLSYLDWKSAAYNDEQYSRLCNYFNERFYFREVSIMPLKEWFKTLRYKLIYELMPKYKPLYEAIENGINPLASEDEYYKERHISSEYPETLLSKNSDYLSSGEDKEYEKIKLANISEMEAAYAEKFRSIDALICDELESLFICMYTANVNGL